jgi:peptide/nickel transport system substrate-binding protein
MLPLPVGVRGVPPDILKTVVGYDPDGEKNRAEAREFMQKLVYGPDKRLNIKVSTRNIATYRDPDYQIGLNLTGSGVDDPDQQSAEADQQKRKALVWDIDKKLQEDVARPIIYHNRGGTFWQPQLKG